MNSHRPALTQSPLRSGIILMRDVGSCTRCQAPKGHACRSIGCPQMHPASLGKPGEVPEILRMQSYLKSLGGGGPTPNGFAALNVFGTWHVQYPGRFFAEDNGKKEKFILLSNDANGDRFKVILK